MTVKNDHRRKFFYLAIGKKPEKIRASMGFEPVTSAKYRCDALPTELWSHTLGARSIYWVHISREEWNGVAYVWNNSYLNYGDSWKWRMIIVVTFPTNWNGKQGTLILPGCDSRSTVWTFQSDGLLCCYRTSNQGQMPLTLHLPS